jgi:hypothetical protein
MAGHSFRKALIKSTLHAQSSLCVEYHQKGRKKSNKKNDFSVDTKVINSVFN